MYKWPMEVKVRDKSSVMASVMAMEVRSLHTLFLKNKAQTTKINYGTMFSCQHKSVCQKLA